MSVVALECEVRIGVEEGARVSVTVDSPMSLAEQAYLELRDRLVMLRIPPGSPINDEHVAA